VNVSGSRRWIAIGVVGAGIAAVLAYLDTPLARAVLAAELVLLLVLLGLRQARLEQGLQALKRGQKSLAATVRDQEIETGLAALNRYASLAGRDLDTTPDSAD
jgi:hypothetical protein